METVAFKWGLKVRSVQEDVWHPSAHAVGIVTDPTPWGQPFRLPPQFGSQGDLLLETAACSQPCPHLCLCWGCGLVAPCGVIPGPGRLPPLQPL